MAKIKLYTDGACSGNPGAGGWAVIVSKDDGITTLGGGEEQTTNNRMEMWGMLTALQYILQDATSISEEKQTTYEVYSDSAYVVNGINNNWLKKWFKNNWKTAKGDPVKNRDLWIQIKEVLTTLNVCKIPFTISKVKGHAGDAMNEAADKEAVKWSQYYAGITK